MSVSGWSQLATPGGDNSMMTPAPVSGAGYQTTTLSEDRANYVRGSLLFTTAYSDNASVSPAGTPLSDISYSIWPSIALDETTSRLHMVFNYSPGFTLYQRMSSLNQMDQNFNVSLQYRLSPHVTLQLADSLQKSSSFYNQPDLASAVPVAGSAQAPVVTVIAPLADQLRNAGNAELTYQFSRDSMIGGGGTFSNLHYPNSSQVPGLFDSNAVGGSAFYSHRFSRKHYLGTTYQYQRIVAYPVGPENLVQTQGILGFYTLQLTHSFSVSVSGGAQHSDLQQAPLPSSKTWSPVEIVSMGWRARRTSLAANYMHVVSGGGGLVGAFHASTANGSVRQQLSKTLTIGATGGYSIYKTVNPLFSLTGSGGHSVTGSATIEYRLRQHLQFQAGYTRLHQSFAEIAAISSPDTNREFITISYQFSRALGR